MATKLTQKEQRVFNFVRLNPGCTSNEFALMFQISNPSAWERLNNLIRKGYMHKEKTHSDNGRPEYKYYIGSISQAQEKIQDSASGSGSSSSVEKEESKVQCTESKSYEPAVIDYIKEHPETSVKAIKIDLNIPETTLRNNIYRLLNKGIIVNVGTPKRHKYSISTPSIQTEETAQEAVEQTTIKPRDLMKQLKALGYTGILNYKKEKSLDFEKLTAEQLKKYQEQGYVGKFVITKKYDINLSKLDV